MFQSCVFKSLNFFIFFTAVSKVTKYMFFTENDRAFGYVFCTFLFKFGIMVRQFTGLYVETTHSDPFFSNVYKRV